MECGGELHQAARLKTESGVWWTYDHIRLMSVSSDCRLLKERRGKTPAGRAATT